MNTARNTVDVLVLGGGPAGMSAALWCAELGLDTILVEKDPAPGGQLRQIYNPVENYLGLRVENGAEMLSAFMRSIDRANFTRVFGSEAIGIDAESGRVTLADQTSISGRAIVIATGVRRRRLGIPGELEFAGRGIIASGVGDRELVRGKRLLIVGGGDAAIENALLLSDVARSIKVAYRAAEPRARAEFVSRLGERSNIELAARTTVSEIKGRDRVGSVVLIGENDHVRQEEFDAVLIRIGVQPNSEFVQATLELDAESYITVSSLGETSRPGIYAVGDVANPISPTISTATGTGATAAKVIYRVLRNKNGI